MAPSGNAKRYPFQYGMAVLTPKFTIGEYMDVPEKERGMFGYEYTIKNRTKTVKAVHLLKDGELLCGSSGQFFVLNVRRVRSKLKCQRCLNAEFRLEVANKMKDMVEYTKTMF